MTNKFHTPVLTEEVIKLLKVVKGEKYIDATLGGGGHATEILKRGGELLGIDHDSEAIEAACSFVQNALNKRHLKNFKVQKGNFINLTDFAKQHGFTKTAGILLDLGVSTHQLTSPTRGFSFSSSAPLDMRMDQELQVTAQDLINGLGKKELYTLFTKYSQEKLARQITKAIINHRSIEKIKNTNELARLVENVYRNKRGKIHPATKVFQALRIAINDEINNLKSVLPQARKLLKPGGRLVVISFHQGEDKIVKEFFNNSPDLKIITKKPTPPTLKEKLKNPRSRSAKLRCAEKL